MVPPGARDTRGDLMPSKEDSGRAAARKALAALVGALDEPPLHRRHQLVLDVVLDLLAEHDLGQRIQARDRLAGVLAELDGELG
jgi:hypothetical protein